MTVNRYCNDCGGRLVYYPRLSNPKASNENRHLVYGCMNCTKDADKPFLIKIHRNYVDDPITTLEVELTQERNMKLRRSKLLTRQEQERIHNES